MPADTKSANVSSNGRAARLRIRTLGGFAMALDQCEIVLSSRKAQALIGYLALSPAGRETRERLVGLLWSEVEEGKARASLRQAIHDLRTAFGHAGFHRFTADKLSVTLDSTTTSVDLIEVVQDAQHGRAHAVLAEHERPLDALLEEFDAVDPAYCTWLLAKRQFFKAHILRLLEAALEAANDARTGKSIARALLNLDPTHETAARALMRIHLADGDCGTALRVYKRLWTLLKEEYDIEPSNETIDLVVAIRLAQPTVEPRAQAKAVVPISSKEP